MARAVVAVAASLAGMTLRIDIWSDIACPWCLIGKRRFEKALAQLDFRDEVEVLYHSFQLDPSLPEHVDGTEADYLAQHKHMAPEQVRQMLAQVTEVAAGEGLAYDFASLKVANSRKGHRLLHGARALDQSGTTTGLQAAVKESLLVGHFCDGLDIGDDADLVTMATRAGMDAEAARQMVGEPALDMGVEMDIATAQGYRVTGVPFYVIGGKYGIAGAEQPEVFVEAITQAWTEMEDQPAPVQLVGGAGEACGPDGCA